MIKMKQNNLMNIHNCHLKVSRKYESQNRIVKSKVTKWKRRKSKKASTIPSWLTFCTQNLPCKTSISATLTLMLGNLPKSAKPSLKRELNAKSYLRNKLRKISKRVKLSAGMKSSELASLPSILTTMTKKKTISDEHQSVMIVNTLYSSKPKLVKFYGLNLY